MEILTQAHADRKIRTKIGMTLLLLLLLAALVTYGTWSAFSGTTENAANAFAAGTVTLTDNDAGVAMLALTNAKPGDTDTSCISVTYTGSINSTVRLYGALTGTLGTYLDLVVTRGTSSSPFDNCSTFSADATNYISQGNGVIYNGTLAAYPASYSAGIVDPIPGSPETWSTSEVHVYRFQVTVQDNNSAQGLTANETFTWEARNL